MLWVIFTNTIHTSNFYTTLDQNMPSPMTFVTLWEHPRKFFRNLAFLKSPSHDWKNNRSKKNFPSVWTVYRRHGSLTLGENAIILLPPSSRKNFPLVVRVKKKWIDDPSMILDYSQDLPFSRTFTPTPCRLNLKGAINKYSWFDSFTLFCRFFTKKGSDH